MNERSSFVGMGKAVFIKAASFFRISKPIMNIPAVKIVVASKE